MAPTNDAQRGIFAIGPTDENCLEVWAPPETVENAHDLGNRDQYSAPLNNNATPLASVPSANR